MKSRIIKNRQRLIKIIDELSVEDGKYICRAIHGDQFEDIYLNLLIIYVFILGSFLLWPFDFVSLVRNEARWIKNSRGIEFLRTGQAVSISSTQDFFDRVVTGRALTIELWLETGDINQIGLARIISYSKNEELCNFVLDQTRDKLIFRLRTTKTSLAGRSPSLVIPDIFSSRSIKHMIIVYDLSKQRVYINGERRAQCNVLKGDFSNWDPSCKLVIGNEVTGNMPWKGIIYYIAIFDRALTEQEIHQNYVSGLRLIKERDMKHSSMITKGPVVRYMFDEEKETVVHDSGSVLAPVNLYMPKYIRHIKEPFFSYSMGSLLSRSEFSDLILNVLIFIPLGILIHGMLRTHYGLALKISLITLIAGTLFSLGVESLQHFSMTRQSSLIDVFTNMIGTSMGIFLDRAHILFLNYQTKNLQVALHKRTE